MSTPPPSSPHSPPLPHHHPWALGSFGLGAPDPHTIYQNVSTVNIYQSLNSTYNKTLWSMTTSPPLPPLPSLPLPPPLPPPLSHPPLRGSNTTTEVSLSSNECYTPRREGGGRQSQTELGGLCGALLGACENQISQNITRITDCRSILHWAALWPVVPQIQHLS